MKKNAGYEYRFKAIRRAIQSVGNYEESVRVWPDPISDKIVFNYKIDESLPRSIIDKLREAIELEAGKLNFDVSMH